MKKHKKAIIFITDCGNGHRSCADSLIYFINNEFPNLKIDIINPYKVIFHSKSEDIYNRYNHLKLAQFFCGFAVFMLKIIFKIRKKSLEKGLTNYLKSEQPNIVISMMPYINGYLATACQNANIKEFSVIMTDWSDEKSIWLDKKIPNLICNSEHAKNLAINLGIANINLVSGMILKPQFYQKLSDNSINLNLDENKKTVLVMYGLGSANNTIKIFKNLEYLADKFQFIILCGNNKMLFDSMANLATNIKIFPVPFIKNPAPYFQLADFFVGKAGPGSLSEAMFFDLPIITELNSFTLVQEQFNAKFLVNRNWGVALKSFKYLPETLENIENGKIRLTKPNNSENLGVFETIKAIMR